MKKQTIILFFIISALLVTCKKIASELGTNATINNVNLTLGTGLDTFTITGTQFSNASLIGSGLVTLYLNNQKINVITANSTTISGTFPASDSAYTGILKVQIGSNMADTSDYPYDLGIDSLKIGQSNSGNLQVTIFGSGFISGLEGNTLTINGVTYTITSATPTEIIATGPSGGASTSFRGVYTISIAGLNPQSLKFGFYLAIDSLVPNAGSAGTLVTIKGSGFSAVKSANLVSFNGTMAQVDSASANVLIVTAPAGGTTGPVSVTVGRNTYTLPVFTYGINPVVISSISVASGVPGTYVLINGSGFVLPPPFKLDTIDNVSFGGASAFVNVISSTQLQAIVPYNGMTGPVVVTVNGVPSTGPVFTVLPSVSTFAGSGNAGSADGSATSASFRNPESGAFDKTGNLFVADYGNNEIRRIDPQGNVTTFAGNVAPGFLDGQGKSARFTNPSALCFDASGNMYVSDELNHSIRKITPGGMVSTIAGTGGSGYRDGQGYFAQFNRPNGITYDSILNCIYVSDSRNNVIRKIDLVSTDVTTFAGSTTAGSADGDISSNPAAASFNSPRGILIWDNRVSGGVEAYSLFVADYGNNKIREIYTASGGSIQVTTYSGNPNNSPGSSDGNTETIASFYDPNGLAARFPKAPSLFNLFIADAANHKIRYVPGISINQTWVETLAGNGTPGLTNGYAGTAQFNYPDGVIYNPLDGNLYVIEFGNNDVRKIILP
jgi:hypothetical protein